MNEIKTTIKQQLILTIMSVLVGVLLGGFALNRLHINRLEKDVDLMKIQWDVMLQMSSPEARNVFNEMVNDLNK